MFLKFSDYEMKVEILKKKKNSLFTILIYYVATKIIRNFVTLKYFRKALVFYKTLQI